MSVRTMIEAGRFENKMEITALDRRTRRNQRAAYRAESMRLEQNLRAALEIEFKMLGNLKANECWRLAWEFGHSCGLSEVAYYYEELQGLVTK